MFHSQTFGFVFLPFQELLEVSYIPPIKGDFFDIVGTPKEVFAQVKERQEEKKEKEQIYHFVMHRLK